MFNQLSLFDLGLSHADDASSGAEDEGSPPSGGLLTLFFGLMPEPAQAKAIARQAAGWGRQFQVGGTLRPYDLLHVSLQAIGGYAQQIPMASLKLARRIGSALSAQSFDVVFDRVMSFKGAHPPFVLLVGEGQGRMQVFRRELGIVIANAGGDRRASTFTPHMTLAYGNHIVLEQPIAPIRWKVKDLALIVSHYGESHYDVISRWPLRDEIRH